MIGTFFYWLQYGTVMDIQLSIGDSICEAVKENRRAIRLVIECLRNDAMLQLTAVLYRRLPELDSTNGSSITYRRLAD